MITPIITVDTRELNAAITRAARDSNRTIAEIVNKKLLFIVKKALALTRKASVDEIRNLINLDPLLPRIINAQRKAQGLPALNDKDMAIAKRKFVAKRVSAVNFIRAQWAWAIAKMLPSVKGGTAQIDVKKSGSPKGGASPAPTVGSLSNATVTASGWNEVKGGKDDVPRVEQIKLAGLQEAIDAETESTWEHIADKEYQRNVCDAFNRGH